jgi:hypothetical protein
VRRDHDRIMELSEDCETLEEKAAHLEALARDLAVALASWEEWAARVRINDGPRYHDTISALVRARALGVYP